MPYQYYCKVQGCDNVVTSKYRAQLHFGDHINLLTEEENFPDAPKFHFDDEIGEWVGLKEWRAEMKRRDDIIHEKMMAMVEGDRRSYYRQEEV